MNKRLPWDEMKLPDKDLAVRAVKGSHSLPLYWGKDPFGHCIFVMELEGDHSESYLKNVVSVRGIRTDLRKIGADDNQGLVITLEKNVDQDLFSSFCHTLILSLEKVIDSAVGLSVALNQIKRWKSFLAGRNSKLLGPEEVRGLFGELLFLQSMLEKGFTEIDSVGSWCGPEDSHQDFIFSNTSVEIKTLSGKERNTVHISSEDQLEGLCDNLFLRIYRLVEKSDSDKALSLNTLVKKIEDFLTNSDGRESFFKKLSEAGYIELQEYDKPKFSLVEERTYRVFGEFPRLIRSRLPEGIIRVGFEIKLEAIEKFKCNSEEIWG